MTSTALSASASNLTAASARLHAVQETCDSGSESRSPSKAPATASASVADFSECVRRIVGIARGQGLTPPAFRSPPRIPGLDRSVQRRQNGSVIIAIRREDRPFAAIQGDVIEGVVVANKLAAVKAEQFRRAAWLALESQSSAPARVAPRNSLPSARSAPSSSPARSSLGRRRVLPEQVVAKVA